MNVSIFAKNGKPTVSEAIDCLKKKFSDVSVYTGSVGDPFPEAALTETPDLLISYISPWIIPETALKNTRKWNINFHPGPPEYPGTGCLNFAIYDGAEQYGATAHIMEKKVDTGKLIDVTRFPLLKEDSVYSLSIKCYDYMIKMFYSVIEHIAQSGTVPEYDGHWTRKPYTRRQLEALCKIEPGMSNEEIDKRVRATYYPGMPGAYIVLNGHKFEYNPKR